MTLVYTPVQTLGFVKERLRAYINPKEIDDDELLRIASEGYQRLCEESLALQTILQVPDRADTPEAALPEDHYRTLRVYRHGLRQQRLPDLVALSGTESGYYEYDGFLGVSPTPSTSTGATWLLYARTPPLPASWTSLLDADFPAEFTYAIVHYVHARVSTAVGGEGRLSQVAWHRSQYEAAVSQMRRRVQTPSTAEVKRIPSPRNGGLRATRTVTAGEGALVIIDGTGHGGTLPGGGPVGDFVTQDEFDALTLDRAAYLGIAGTLSGSMNDAADFPFIMPFASTILRIKATLRTATTTNMTVQLRKAGGPDAGAYADVGGIVLTFPPGSKGTTFDSVDLNVGENDVLNLSVQNGSGTNLSFVCVFSPINAHTGPGNIVAGGVLAGTYPNPSFAVDMATQAELEAAFTHATAAPTAGTHLLSEVVWHSNPTPGGNVGWVCTTGGVPGIWKPFGTIGA